MNRKVFTPETDGFHGAWYERGTHFAFPQSMLKMILPVGSSLLVKVMFKAGREYPVACKQTRIDIDRRLTGLLKEWQG